MKVTLISANTEPINMPVLPVGMAFVAKAAEDAGQEGAEQSTGFISTLDIVKAGGYPVIRQRNRLRIRKVFSKQCDIYLDRQRNGKDINTVCSNLACKEDIYLQSHPLQSPF